MLCAAFSSASLVEFNQCAQFIRKHIDFQPQRHENKMYSHGYRNDYIPVIFISVLNYGSECVELQKPPQAKILKKH